MSLDLLLTTALVLVCVSAYARSIEHTAALPPARACCGFICRKMGPWTHILCHNPLLRPARHGVQAVALLVDYPCITGVTVLLPGCIEVTPQIHWNVEDLRLGAVLGVDCAAAQPLVQHLQAGMPIFMHSHRKGLPMERAPDKEELIAPRNSAGHGYECAGALCH